MLTRVEITHFKCFERLVLPLAPLTLLSGANAAGKSTLLQALVLRHSVATGAVVASLVTGQGDLPHPEHLVSALRAACPALQGFLWLQQPRPVRGRSPWGRERWRWGEPTLREELAGHTYRVSPSSFFQVNTAAAQELVRLVLGALGPGAHLLDACCGVGTFAIAAARQFRRVTGIEVHPPAVEDARANAAAQDLRHLRFLQGTPARVLAASPLDPTPSHILVDPPRGGLDAPSLEALAALGAPRWVYVSCDAGTLARDLRRLAAHGYHPTSMLTADLFPQTSHVEGVVHLERQRPAPPG